MKKIERNPSYIILSGLAILSLILSGCGSVAGGSCKASEVYPPIEPAMECSATLWQFEIKTEKVNIVKIPNPEGGESSTFMELWMNSDVDWDTTLTQNDASKIAKSFAEYYLGDRRGEEIGSGLIWILISYKENQYSRSFQQDEYGKISQIPDPYAIPTPQE